MGYIVALSHIFWFTIKNFNLFSFIFPFIISDAFLCFTITISDTCIYFYFIVSTSTKRFPDRQQSVSGLATKDTDSPHKLDVETNPYTMMLTERLANCYNLVLMFFQITINAIEGFENQANTTNSRCVSVSAVVSL